MAWIEALWTLWLRFCTYFYAVMEKDNNSFVNDLKSYCSSNSISLSYLSENRHYHFYCLRDHSLCIDQGDINLHIVIRLRASMGKVYLTLEKIDPIIHRDKQKMGSLIVRGIDVFAKILACSSLYNCYIFVFRPYCNSVFYKSTWNSLGFYTEPSRFCMNYHVDEEHIRAKISEIVELFQF